MVKCGGITKDGLLCEALALPGSNGCRWHKNVDEDVSDTESSTSITLTTCSPLATCSPLPSENSAFSENTPLSMITHVSETDTEDFDLTCHEDINSTEVDYKGRITPVRMSRSLQDESRTLLWIQDPPLTVIEFLKWSNRGVPNHSRFGVASITNDDADSFNHWIERKNHRFL
jgi:hypothetical protein